MHKSGVRRKVRGMAQPLLQGQLTSCGGYDNRMKVRRKLERKSDVRKLERRKLEHKSDVRRKVRRTLGHKSGVRRKVHGMAQPQLQLTSCGGYDIRRKVRRKLEHKSGIHRKVRGMAQPQPQPQLQPQGRLTSCGSDGSLRYYT